MNLKGWVLLIMVVTIFIRGCASLKSGTTQEISFQSNPKDVVVTVDGNVIGKTPTTVQLAKKSKQSLQFSKVGYKSISMQLKTSIDNWFWGNILFGGLFGSTTDGISGAMYKYSPNKYFVTLQPEGTNRVDSPTVKNQRDKAKEFIISKYADLIADISKGSGEDLNALMTLLTIPADQQEDSLKKMRILSKIFNDPPTFADQLIALPPPVVIGDAPTERREDETTIEALGERHQPVTGERGEVLVPASIAFGRYHALVIGNNAYTDVPALQTAVSDAQAMSEMLQQEYGFKVRLLQNATRDEILIALTDYRETLSEQENLLIYYAGHGVLDRDEARGYWLPVNADRRVRTNWVANDDITTAVRAMNAKHVMVVADSCYSGALTRDLKVEIRAPNHLARLSKRKARTVLTSGGLEPVLDSGGGSHSVFAKAFLDVLRENQGVMDGSTFFSKLRRPVMVNSDQTPEYGDIRKAGHDGGDFLFVRKK